DQYRAQHIVDQADNPGAEGREHNRLPDGSRDQEVNGDRCPDQGGAHRRYQRGENHHGPPQYRSLHAEHPEDKAAEHALHDGDDQIAAHGGPNDVDDALHQQPLLVSAERQSADNQFDDGAAVAQKKEGHIQHHREADQELGGVLADAQHLRAHIAANLDRRILESLAQLADIYTEPIQYVLHGGWQFSAAFDVTQKIDVAGLNFLVKLGAFMRQRHGHAKQGQDDDDGAQQQYRQRQQVVVGAEAGAPALLQRKEQNGDNRCPQYCTEERPDDPAEQTTYDGQAQQQRPLSQ